MWVVLENQALLTRGVVIHVQGPDVFPIPGTKRLKYLEENLGALKAKLTSEEVREIRKAAETAEIKGARYPATYTIALFADTI